jgi:hypothetical protein
MAMSDNLRELSSELGQVEAAIHDAPLYADPSNPDAGFSDRLVELVAQEERVLGQIIEQARQDVSSEI